MPNPPNWSPGRFVWHEILTPDIRRSRAFYSNFLGWKYQSFVVGGDRYELILVDGLPQGGLMSTAGLVNDGASAHVMGYVSVADVDAAVRAGTEAGGSVCAGPLEVPSVGRLAVLADATGATFSVLRSNGGDAPVPARPAVGQFCWDQLNTADLLAASRYYRAVLGWKSRALTEHDSTEVFLRQTESGETRAAGFLPSPLGVPSHWVSYIAVDNLPAARTRGARLGARMLIEPRSVPGLGTVAVLQDNAGATIGLFEMKP